MKIYIAARAKNRINDVKQIQKRLTDLGHSITYDWAEDDSSIKKPYRAFDSRKANNPAIRKMLNAAAEADVFILLDEAGLRGAYVEMGAFLQKALKDPQGHQMFIVGPNSHEREHIFESPEFVRYMDNIEEVYAVLS